MRETSSPISCIIFLESGNSSSEGEANDQQETRQPAGFFSRSIGWSGRDGFCQRLVNVECGRYDGSSEADLQR